KQLIELHLSDPYIVQEVLRERPQLLCRFNQPLQHRIRLDLEHPRRAPDAQALSQARDDTHDEVDGGTLPMKDRPEALQDAAATGDAEQLPPGTTVGMAIGAEIAPAHPTPVRTVRIGTEMGRGIDLTGASSRHHHAWGRSAGGLWARATGVRTGV